MFDSQRQYPIHKISEKFRFLIKVDTNGSQPKVLEKLIEEQLIDYVALDFKGPKEKFLRLQNRIFMLNF